MYMYVYTENLQRSFCSSLGDLRQQSMHLLDIPVTSVALATDITGCMCRQFIVLCSPDMKFRHAASSTHFSMNILMSHVSMKNNSC